ncbi:MAG: alpha/beta hydrolase [Chloroflexaceae bacterium]|nr:alpha/beta hydrolase [Chloroflexaceae bacterium]
MGLRHETVQVNGIQMHYVIAGSGPLLLLLHGFPEFWWSWRHQIEHFCADFTVVAPDLRGYNDTDKPTWGYEIDVLLADLVEFMRSLGFHRAVVRPPPLGGMLAWGLAIHYPYRVDRLIVLNAPHPGLVKRSLCIGSSHTLRSLATLFVQVPWLPEALLQANDYALVRWLLRGRAVRKDAFSDDVLETYQDAISKPGALKAALSWYRFTGSFRELFYGYPVMRLLNGKSSCIQAPTLLLWGEKHRDQDVPLTYGTERYVTDLHLRCIPNCSLRILHENPALVNQYMAVFLESREVSGERSEVNRDG